MSQVSFKESVSRYEAKFLIPEVMVDPIREHIQAMCSPDPYTGPDGLYMVNNLYFDTLDLRFYHDTRFKQYVRFKPRIRFYGMELGEFVWLEVKHKLRNVTWKVRRRTDSAILPRCFDTLPFPTDGRDNITDSFEDIVLRYNAKPILQVRYVREAWVSDIDTYGRITFDHALTSKTLYGADSLIADDTFLPFDDAISTGFRGDESPVVLEIKTNVDVPLWVVGMIRMFGLKRVGFSKYCNGLERSASEILVGDRGLSRKMIR